MVRAVAPTRLRCRPGWNADRSRCGLVLDYRGDDPPHLVLDALRAAGWATPAPLAPPKEALDWDHPDPGTGRRWSLRPFLVTGAVVVAGADLEPGAATVDELRRILGRCGVTLDEAGVRVHSLARPNPGYAELASDATVDHGPPPTLAPTPAGPTSPRPGTGALSSSDGRAVGPSAAGPLRFEPPDRLAVGAARPPVSARDATDPVVVTASIRPASLGQVVTALDALGVLDDAWATTATGWGAGGGRVVRFRGRTTVEMDQRVHLQVAVAGHRAELVVGAVADAARAGGAGDGTAWIV